MFDYFKYFDLTPDFRIDEADLERRYLELARRFHPDHQAGADAFEVKQSMMTMSAINDAYRTLMDPLRRAHYMLKEKGVDAFDEMETVFPPDMLMEQFEWRERAQDALAEGDSAAMAELAATVGRARREAMDEFAERISSDDVETCRVLVAKIKFIDRLLDGFGPEAKEAARAGGAEGGT